MKILVIDNNIQTVKNITVLLKNIISDVRIVEMSNSCETALVKVKQMQYDLIMVNISFHGFDGFEIANRLKAEGHGFYFVMYGDREDSEIYRRCMELRALEYLIKPITAKALSELLEKYFIRRQEDRVLIQSNRELMLQQSMELIEFSFISSMIYSEHITWEWEKYQYLLNVSNLGYVLFLEPEVKTQIHVTGYNLFCRRIRQEVSNGYRCIIGKEQEGRIVVIVMTRYGFEPDGKISWEERSRYATLVKNTFYEFFHTKAAIGIGEQKTMENLRISYEEAMRAARYGGMGVVQDKKYEKQESSVIKKRQFFYELEEKFVSSIREGNHEALNQLFVLLDLIKDMSFEEKKNKIFELLVISVYLSRYDGKNENEYMNYTELFHQMESIKESDLNLWASRNVSNILKSIRDYHNENLCADVTKAIRYMETHYDEDIFMEDVAAIINISPQYFSRIFRERTGMTYVDYLTNIRIRKAKEWLSCSQNNIQEICFKVGYKDPNYFSRVFKKMVGVTPKQYKVRKAESVRMGL